MSKPSDRNEAPKFEVWVTKYALTKGIIKYMARVPHNPNDRMIVVERDYNDPLSCTQYFHTPDWHLSREEAVARAEKVRQAKIKALEKNIQQLKNLRFE